MARQEEEVLGKAYDGRLMRRLLGYVRPYWPQVLLATLAAVLHSVTQVVGPFLNKVVIDQYLFPTHAPGAHSFLSRYLPADAMRGLTALGVLYLLLLRSEERR